MGEKPGEADAAAAGERRLDKASPMLMRESKHFGEAGAAGIPVSDPLDDPNATAKVLTSADGKPGAEANVAGGGGIGEPEDRLISSIKSADFREAASDTDPTSDADADAQEGTISMPSIRNMKA